MKLWHITRNDVRWDEVESFLIRSETEESARQLATTQTGTELESEWLDANKSSCVEVLTEGSEEIIIREYISG